MTKFGSLVIGMVHVLAVNTQTVVPDVRTLLGMSQNLYARGGLVPSFIAGADDRVLLQLAYHLYTAILLPGKFS